MPIACKICILQKGLNGSEIDSLFQTDEELFDHIEKEHHIAIIREGETEEKAIIRFLKKYPEAKDCPKCRAMGAPWTLPTRQELGEEG